jgi:formate dehydrogenase major subunit
MMNAILKSGHEKKDFIASKTKDFEKCKAVVSGSSYSAEAVAKTCGISADLVTKAAEIYAAAPAAAVITSAGATSGDLIRAVANLQLITGNIGKAGAGVDLLRGKSNAQGAMDMGCVPGENGAAVPAMIAGAAAGKIKAMYVMGENIASAGAHVPEALGKLDFLIVQDMFMTETAQKAHVVLPSAAFAERDGTFTNSERRVQRVRKAVEPAGSSKADCQIICELAKVMGHEKEFAFATAEHVFSEIAKHVPTYAGITYAMLEKPEAVQWPAAGGVFGTPVLYAGKFATKDGKAAF